MPSIISPLTQDGAIVEVLVGVSHHRATLLQARQLPVPEPVRLRFLVDTGACGTNIAQGLLAFLGAPSTGKTQVHTASTGSVPLDCDEYDVSLVFPDALPMPWGIGSLSVTECPPLDGPIDGLLGRDVLNRAMMTYNPFTKVVTISF